MAIPRLYSAMLADHLRRHRQMAFVTGPRQVGKTTTCRSVVPGIAYLDWDDSDDRRVILAGAAAVAQRLGLERLRRERPTVVFDELHKYGHWKSFLKGFFDKHAEDAHIIVTGSSRLDAYRRGGDSLMGRYLSYRMHPLSVGELARHTLPNTEIAAPARVSDATWNALWTHGGYPEPFTKRDRRFSLRWRDLRMAQLVREDIRDLTRIQELSQIDVLAQILASRPASTLKFSSLASEIRVSVDTIRRWVETLCALHFGFLVRPWFKNVAKALRKEPKWYLSDWSGVADPGQRAETFVACHLQKAVHAWSDLGLGRYELRYLRDKNQREVDFLVVRDARPWFLVEVKATETALSPPLAHFQAQVAAKHAFQVVTELGYVGASCFDRSDPCVVPARTLLSQLP